MMGSEHGNYCGPSDTKTYTPEDKAHAVELVMKGGRVKDVALLCETTRRTILRWIVAERGEEAARVALTWSDPDMLHEFPAWVKAECVRHDLTPKRLAEMAGLCQATVYNMFSGRNYPSFPVAVKIIDVLTDLDRGWNA